MTTPPTQIPGDPGALHAWIRTHLGIELARTPMVEGHSAPFDYICHAYFEGAIPARSVCAPASNSVTPSLGHSVTSPDCTVWANRGGGKTFLGAIATLLDMVFKPGVQVRILGGSLEQSQRMHEHLRRLCERPIIAELIEGRPTARRIRFIGGSCVEVLAASQTSVRGTRVQKLRCDEVDLFDPELWEAAQLTTRSMRNPGPWGPIVRGSVEALSTMHRPYGLMWNLVLGARGSRVAADEAHADAPTPASAASLQSSPPHPATPSPRQVFRWGLLDVLEPCGDEHRCEACVLHEECAGRAKAPERRAGAGHISVADSASMKSRVDRATWTSEMLCLRPRRTDTVYPEFDPAAHVHADDGAPAPGGAIRIAGMDFGFRGQTVILLARLDGEGVLHVEREHAAAGCTLAEHIGVISRWIEDGHAPGGIAWIGVDPAGRQVNAHSGESSVSVLARAGFVVRSRPGGVQEGIRLVRARLGPAAWAHSRTTTPLTLRGEPAPAHAPDPIAPSSRPRLRIHARCTGLIEALERYHYPPDRPESLEPVKDGADHACDALRYMIMNLDSPFVSRTRRY